MKVLTNFFALIYRLWVFPSIDCQAGEFTIKTEAKLGSTLDGRRSAMISRGFSAISYAVITIGLLALVGCSAQIAARRPSLAEARAGQTPPKDRNRFAGGENRGEGA